MMNILVLILDNLAYNQHQTLCFFLFLYQSLANQILNRIYNLIHIKDNKQIRLIQESSTIVFDVLESLNELIMPGVSPKELDIFAENYIKKSGGIPAFKGYLGFPSTLCVSINEEASDLILFQRAYQAAARIVSTVDELFQTILNM